MNDVAIKLENVSKYYKLYKSPKDRLKEALSPFGKKYHKKFYAAKSLNLLIKKCEILGIVGKNGSGKSTLLKLISKILIPDEGNVQVNGKISALLELGSGFNPEFTGLQNIYFFGTIHGFSRKDMEKKIDEIIAFADIGEFIDQPIKTYSSGMKSRLGFAVAVHIDPEILILDEVLAVGDINFRRKCYAKMEAFFREGKMILYVSHDMNSVNKLCSRAIFLNEGSILLDADAKTVTSYYQKYIFSNEEIQKEMIEQLNKGSYDVSEMSVHKHSLSEVVENADNKAGKYPADGSKAFWLESFKSKTIQKIQHYDIQIAEPKILTDKKEQVNMLVLDEIYYLKFVIKTPVDIKEVSYGARIKTIKGEVISNASLKNADQFIVEMEKGDYLITWSFVCKLLPGIYYIDTSITGIINEEREVLCRIFDHLPFKVLEQKNLLYQGMVKLDQELSFEKIS